VVVDTIICIVNLTPQSEHMNILFHNSSVLSDQEPQKQAAIHNIHNLMLSMATNHKIVQVLCSTMVELHSDIPNCIVMTHRTELPMLNTFAVVSVMLSLTVTPICTVLCRCCRHQGLLMYMHCKYLYFALVCPMHSSQILGNST